MGVMAKRRTLAPFLRAWLDEHEVTQRQLADELEGVTESRVSRWVNGHEVPAASQRDALAARLGVTRHDLDLLCIADRKTMARAELLTIERAVRRLRGMIDPD